MKKVLLAVLCAASVTFAYAQKIKGSVDFLKGQNNVNIVFVFEATTFDGESQESYLKEKTKRADSEAEAEKEVSEWKAKWEGEGRNTFKQIFIRYCSYELENFSFKLGEYPDAAYTIVVTVEDVDPGNFAGPFSHPAKLKAFFDFVKTGETNALAMLKLEDIYNPEILSSDEFARMKGGFGELGKELGTKLKKALK
ncbi:MAG: hypothetical protein LBS94_05235 [Prevotellaceae bacterium]|jgi:hypothetical protein|nr:hypothetical protein [Prevotellaceae bacterium]